MGLNIGADDVTKPFTPMELMARVNLVADTEFMEKLEVRENVHVIGGLRSMRTLWKCQLTENR